MNFETDIPQALALQSHAGVSWTPEKRAEQVTAEYAGTLRQDYEALRAIAERHDTLPLLDAEFARYRDGYRRRTIAWLGTLSRCVSSWIAGPSNFPAARMQKRMDVERKRSQEAAEFRSRALAAIKRTLTPDLQPIRSEDSDAAARLLQKIQQAEDLQARMKAANAAVRKAKKAGPDAQVSALVALGFSAATALELLKPDFAGRVGFADFELTNNGANIRRMKARLEQVTAQQAAPAQEAEGERATVEDCPADNRIRVWFPGKPDEATRSDLKRNGFRWTPSLGCWQAYRNHSAQQAARRIAGVEV